MRIVNRHEFLAMPAGTVFVKFPAQPADGSHIDLGYDGIICIKEDTVGDDFIVQELLPYFEDVNDGGDWADVMSSMLEGKTSPPLDYECTVRDGLFDEKQLFLVWDKIDLERMIGRLNAALLSGYGL